MAQSEIELAQTLNRPTVLPFLTWQKTNFEARCDQQKQDHRYHG
jgi:hypothetical protein